MAYQVTCSDGVVRDADNSRHSQCALVYRINLWHNQTVFSLC
jgi:hypothetical protein